MEQSKIDNIQKLIKMLEMSDIDLTEDILHKYNLMKCWSCGINLVQFSTTLNENDKEVMLIDDSQYCKECKFYQFEPNMTKQEKINDSMHYRMVEYMKERGETHTLDKYYWQQNEVHLECKDCKNYQGTVDFVALYEDHNGDMLKLHCIFCGEIIEPLRDIYNRVYEECSKEE